MIATAERSPDTATHTVAPPAELETTKAEQPAEPVVRRLVVIVLYGKPRRAIAAFRSLTVLCKFYKETFDRIIELCRTGRPTVAAAAVNALVQARLARKRYQDGR